MAYGLFSASDAGLSTLHLDYVAEQKISQLENVARANI
jgi:hypothetical protein